LLEAIRVWLVRLKPYGRWGVVGVAIAFLIHTLHRHWTEVTTIRLEPAGASLLLLALGVTLLAHSWSGWVWGWILQALQLPVGGVWSTLVYLKTNLWKYLPGNVWHFYGRVRALKEIGIDNGPAIVGVVLEPVLMAAAALLLGLASPTPYWPWQLVGLALVLFWLHPRWLNPVIQRLSRGKAKPDPEAEPDSETEPPPMATLQRYPLQPLLGEMGFVLLRGLGFGLVVSAVSPLPATAWPAVVSRFSLAWLAGLVVPGAPGGLGVFEAIAVTLLQDLLSPAGVLSAVALYRLIGTLAEALGAGLALLDQRLGDGS
jgi:glycosyltransferase 2 family protein